MTQATSTYDNRNKDIKAIHSRYEDFYRIGGGLTVIIILILIGTWVFGQNQFEFADTMLGYITNVATEALSVVATIIVIDQLNRRREREDRKLALFRQAKSRSNDNAIEALDQILHEGWWDALLEHYRRDDEIGRVDLSQVQWSGGVQLKGVNLEEVDLKEANLTEANLYRANLTGADSRFINLKEADLGQANLVRVKLYRANLEGADLKRANLKDADLGQANLTATNLEGANLERVNLKRANLTRAKLRFTNLKEADLAGANLERANLWEANLEGISLAGANLEGADLKRANLTGVIWVGADLFEGYSIATLPDGTKWTGDTDMARFTDPEHPDFWSPEKDESDSTE